MSKHFKSRNKNDSVTIEEKSNHNDSVLNLYILFHQLIIVLSGLKSGVLNFTRIVD